MYNPNEGRAAGAGHLVLPEFNLTMPSLDRHMSELDALAAPLLQGGAGASPDQDRLGMHAAHVARTQQQAAAAAAARNAHYQAMHAQSHAPYSVPGYGPPPPIPGNQYSPYSLGDSAGVLPPRSSSFSAGTMVPPPPLLPVTLSPTILASSPNLAAGHAGAGFARSRRGSSNSQNGGAGGGGAGGTSPYARPVSPSGPRRGSAASSASPVFAAGSLSPTFAPSDDGGVNGPPTGAALKRSGAAGAGRKTKPLEKKYLCDFPGCDKAFDRPFNLRQHVRTHNGEKPFPCDKCDKAFSRAHDLKRHTQAIHDNNKPFKCLRCMHRFTRNDALQRHVRGEADCEVFYRTHGLDAGSQSVSPSFDPVKAIALGIPIPPGVPIPPGAHAAAAAMVAAGNTSGSSGNGSASAANPALGVPAATAGMTPLSPLASPSVSPYMTATGYLSPMPGMGFPAPTTGTMDTGLPHSLPAPLGAYGTGGSVMGGPLSPNTGGMIDAFQMISIPSPSEAAAATAAAGGYAMGGGGGATGMDDYHHFSLDREDGVSGPVSDSGSYGGGASYSLSEIQVGKATLERLLEQQHQQQQHSGSGGRADGVPMPVSVSDYGSIGRSTLDRLIQEHAENGTLPTSVGYSTLERLIQQHARTQAAEHCSDEAWQPTISEGTLERLVAEHAGQELPQSIGAATLERLMVEHMARLEHEGVGSSGNGGATAHSPFGYTPYQPGAGRSALMSSATLDRMMTTAPAAGPPPPLPGSFGASRPLHQPQFQQHQHHQHHVHHVVQSSVHADPTNMSPVDGRTAYAGVIPPDSMDQMMLMMANGGGSMEVDAPPPPRTVSVPKRA